MPDFDSLSFEQQLPILLELAEAATKLYALPDNITIKLVNLSENATYKIEAPHGQRWALRIHRDGYHSKTAIASEIFWAMDLRASGVVTTPAPAKGKDGEIIQHLAHHRMPRPRNIVLFDWETGIEPGIGEDLIEPFKVLGETAARMHEHTRKWKRPHWFERLTWNFETSLGDANPHWGRWRDGIGVDAERAALFGRTVERIGQRLLRYGKSADRFGLIHCDLRLANLLIDGKAVKVIDFDDCGFGWYMYDAATPVSFYEDEPQVPSLIEAWKEGYRRVLPLAREDEAEIPTFIMLRRLLLVAWIGSHKDTDLAKSMGLPYTEGTVALCEDYLRKMAGITSRLGLDSRRKAVATKRSAEGFGRTALVVGTFDTKGEELRFIVDKLHALGIATKTIDLSTSGKPSSADVSPSQVASMHPLGTSAVFGTDRGQSVTAMAKAFARWIERENDIGGVISAGGSGGTTLATAGMRKLPVGIPKLMVSTVASGEVGHYIGPSDIMMMYSVADVLGINPITEQVLSNAANALAGMIAGMPDAAVREAKRRSARPAVGLTMFGVTTPCVQALQKKLEADYDCLIFHATGTGGRSMEKLADSGLINAMMDITTTEVADMVVGGVFAADADRFGSAIRTGVPYVGSVGALDMVNFGPRNTVPEKFNARNFVMHNPNVTLMRTTRDENRAMGQWIAERLNLMQGSVRFLLPEGGVSLLDAPGKPFHDEEADNALFEAIEKTLHATSRRTVQRVKANINDPLFVEAALDAFISITPKTARSV